MKYYLAINGNAALIQATTQISLENIMLSEKKADTKGPTQHDSIIRNVQKKTKSSRQQVD